MEGARDLKPEDKIIIYRTSDGAGPATYRSVASSICTVTEIKIISDFTDIDDFIHYTNRYSVFTERDLRYWYNKKPNFVVIKMLYNIAFQKKVIRKDIIEQVGIPSEERWGIMPLADAQFNQLLTLGQADGRYIIN